MDSKKKGELQRLLEEKEKILEQNPELKKFQDQIDLALLEAGDDPEARLMVIIKMMLGQLGDELIPTVEKLIEPYKNVVSISDKLEELKKNLKRAKDQSEENVENNPKKKVVQ